MKDNNFKSSTCLLLISALFLFSSPAFCQPDKPKEFRGIWIATINNIDWPSAPGLPVEQQKKELRTLIGRIEKFHLNAVFFQVRPASDAFYSSSIEPWSYFLSAKQGKPTDPFFDPLAYLVQLCHEKGIELYAWFNPFRVRNVGFYELAKNSFAAKYPQYQHDYDNKRFFDPGFPQVREHVTKVILEVVKNYAVDGVLLDDYFYPYPVNGKKFPDTKTFAKYGKEFFPNRLKDWRRNNIDCFISDLHKGIHSIKPSVKFGISPFGVWRTRYDDPEGSPLIKGTTSFDDLYADIYKWLSQDWIDFVIPQLYWEQGNRYGDFNALAAWWNNHCFGKPLYLGQALYKSTGSGDSWKNPKEISDQLRILRKFENVKGFAFFSASHLSKLPEEETNELMAMLGPRIENDFHDSRTEVAILAKTPETVIRELINDKTSFDSIVNLKDYAKYDALPASLKFRLKRIINGWMITFDSLKNSNEKNFLLGYQPKKESGYLKKAFVPGDKGQITLSKDFKPRKVLYSFVSLHEGQPKYSQLFRIRKNRVIYW